MFRKHRINFGFEQQAHRDGASNDEFRPSENVESVLAALFNRPYR
jgi:hypothetical protein